MTPSYGELDIKAECRRSTEASGVPYHVEDAATLDRLAGMFASAIKPQAKGPRWNGSPKHNQTNEEKK